MKRQGRDNKRIIIGITGSFGSGKTTVAMILKSFGAQIIDADKIAHAVIKPSGEIYKRIIHTFGKNLLKKNRSIDRNRLAEIVFNNKDLLGRLNKIIHPEIIRIIKSQIKTSSKKVVILDAPLLIETGLRKLVDRLIVVKINPKKQLQRILDSKPLLSKTDILKRIDAQMPLKLKTRFADFVIDNSRTINYTKRQVIRIWKKLQPLKH